MRRAIDCARGDEPLPNVLLMLRDARHASLARRAFVLALCAAPEKAAEAQRHPRLLRTLFSLASWRLLAASDLPASIAAQLRALAHAAGACACGDPEWVDEDDFDPL